MLNSTTAGLIRSKISDHHTLNVSAYNPSGLESHSAHGTSHISTADHSGLAVTMTSTINLLFGSQVMAPSSGIIMNNEMNDFSIPGFSNAFGYVPSPANFIRPGKRPLSSITPTIVEHGNGTLYFVTGAAGGSRIITSTLLSIINVLDFNMTAPSALKAPRLHDQLLPNHVAFEWSYDNGTVDFMRGRGHNVSWVGPGESSVQSIRVLGNGTFEAAGEPRQMSSGGFAV
jgi:gamma-glutamyltranspeptidase / glutathione hydrolase